MVEVAVDEAGVTNFEGCVVEAAGSLLKLAYLLTGNVADAEELLQETFARVFVAWPQVEAADDPDAYVRQVLINANRRRFRRHREPRYSTVTPEKVSTVAKDSPPSKTVTSWPRRSPRCPGASAASWCSATTRASLNARWLRYSAAAQAR